MNKYEFELHLHNNEPNQLITIQSDTLIQAYYSACDLYPNVLAIVSTDPTAA